MAFSKCFGRYTRQMSDFCFGRHPLATNVVLSGCLAASSDFVAQKFVQGYETLDTQRTRHMVTYGCTTAPLWHLWYKSLDRYIKASKVWLKVVLDQTTATPLDYVGFFAVFNFVKGESLEECVSELNRVFFKALVPDTMFWPTATFVGYKWVPLTYRFMYFECLQFFWDTFLSYLKYSGKGDHTSDSTEKLEDANSETIEKKSSIDCQLISS